MKSGDIQVKDSQVLKALMLHTYDPVLVDIICLVADQEGICITEGWREALHPKDVHNTDPCRANDVRTWCYKNPYKIKDLINNRWEYDPERPHKQVAIIHNTGKGIHFHIQTHPNTRRRKP